MENVQFLPYVECALPSLTSVQPSWDDYGRVQPKFGVEVDGVA